MFQFLDIASSQNHIVWFEGSYQACRHIRHIAPPLFLASFFECCAAHVVLVRGRLVREVAEFHWFQDAVHNQGRTETRAQTEEEHLAALVTSQGLHGRIVYDFDWTAEGGFEVKADPSSGQVMRVGNRPVLYDCAGISH